jgi:5-methylcytosine-specific restriction endonuclease McrA
MDYGAALRKHRLRAVWLRKRVKLQANKCAICGGLMAPLGQPCKRGTEATLDHVQPLSRGGADHWENTQAAHLDCNQKKGASWTGADELRA